MNVPGWPNPFTEKKARHIDVDRQSKAIREHDRREMAGENDPEYVHRWMIQEEISVYREALEKDDLTPAERKEYMAWYFQLTGEKWESPE